MERYGHVIGGITIFACGVLVVAAALLAAH